MKTGINVADRNDDTAKWRDTDQDPFRLECNPELANDVPSLTTLAQFRTRPIILYIQSKHRCN